MNAVLLLAAMTVGIDVGYEPLPEGGVVYIIQIEPQLLGRLAGGENLESAVPSELDVRRYRITVGSGALPREAPAVRQPRAEVEPAMPAERPQIVEDRVPDATPNITPTEPADRGADLLGPRYATEPAAAPPRTLEPAPRTNPLVGQPASFDDPQSATHQAEKRPSLEPEETANSSRPTMEKPSESKPWLPLVLTTMALMMSLAGNIYLGWIAWAGRARYQALLEKFANEPVAV